MLHAVLFILLGVIIALAGGYYWLRYGFPWDKRTINYNDISQRFEKEKNRNKIFLDRISADPAWSLLKLGDTQPNVTNIFYNRTDQEIAMIRYGINTRGEMMVFSAGRWQMNIARDRENIVAYFESCLRLCGLKSGIEYTLRIPCYNAELGDAGVYAEIFTDTAITSQMRLLVAEFRQTLNWTV